MVEGSEGGLAGSGNECRQGNQGVTQTSRVVFGTSTKLARRLHGSDAEKIVLVEPNEHPLTLVAPVGKGTPLAQTPQL